MNRLNTAKFAFLFFALFCTGAAASPAVVIQLKSDAVVSSDQIRLGDIASIRNAGVGTDRLRNASLGFAPAIGNARPVTKHKIKLVVAAAGFAVGSFTIKGPNTIYVRRQGQRPDRSMVVERLSSVIYASFEQRAQDLTISTMDLPDLPEVPFGEIEIRSDLRNVRNIFAPFSMPFEIYVNSRLVHRMSARINVEAFADVYTAVGEIPANTPILPQMVTVSRVRLSKPVTQYLVSESDLRGIRSARDIRTGEAVTRSEFVADIVVKNGDRVRIIGTSGRLKLSINGVAQAAGRIGDRIVVKNLQSNQLLQAKISDVGIVEIFF